MKDNGNGPLPVGIKSAVLASGRSFCQSACPQIDSSLIFATAGFVTPL